MQVGTTKDQGLYNKPSAAVHPVALATGTLPQRNTIQLPSINLFFFSSRPKQDEIFGENCNIKMTAVNYITFT